MTIKRRRFIDSQRQVRTVFFALLLTCLLSPIASALGGTDVILVSGFESTIKPPGENRALRFFGNGVDDIDRVKIALDDPFTNLPGPLVDVGIDFTLEFWMRAIPGENNAGAVSCGNNNEWINGNIILDRDRFNQGRAYGLSIANRRLVWGIDGEFTSVTICGNTIVDDDNWHHIAAVRRESDGRMWIFVDGQLDAQGDGPTGDVSYPDDGMQTTSCGGLANGSDPFLVIGAEKHDCNVKQFPSYSGIMDELRISDSARYTLPFTPPSARLGADANTVALYHMDETSGEIVEDSAQDPGEASDGVLHFGGNPAGPLRVPSTAPTGSLNPGSEQRDRVNRLPAVP